MPKLSSWQAAAGTLIVTPDATNLSKFAISSVAIDSGVLDSIDTAERASGWAAPLVTKNRARRSAKKDVWISTKGITVGTAPLAELMGHPDALAFGNRLNETLFYDSATWGIPTTVAADKAMNALGIGNQRLAALRTDTDLARRFFSWATGFDVGPGTLQFTDTNIYAYASFDTFSKNKCIVGMTNYVVKTEIAGVITFITYTCDTFAKHGGLHRMYFGYNVTGDTAAAYLNGGNATFDGFTYYLMAIDGPANLKVILNKAIGAFAAGGKAWTNTTPLSVSVTTFPAGGDLNDVFPGVQLNHYQYYTIGEPEFMSSVSYVGDVTIDGNVVSIANPRMCLEWPGSLLRLASSGGTSASEADLLVTDKMLMRTFVSPTQRKVATTAGALLAQLTIYPLAQEAGVDLKAEQFCPADPAHGELALTFGEAEKRALGAEYTVCHQMVRGWSNGPIRVTSLLFSGTSLSSYILTGYNAGTAVLDLTKDEAAEAIGRGVIPVCTIPAVTAEQAIFDFFGSHTTDMVGPFKAIKTDDGDFDERGAFSNTIPDPDSLAPSKRAGFLMVQFCRNRKALTGFVITGIMMGRAAARQLLTFA